MVAFSIGGDWSWTGTSTLSTVSFNNLSASGTGNVTFETLAGTFDVGSLSGATTIHGSPLWCKAEATQLKLTAGVGQTIDINGDGGNLSAINIGTLFAPAINIGASPTTTLVTVECGQVVVTTTNFGVGGLFGVNSNYGENHATTVIYDPANNLKFNVFKGSAAGDVTLGGATLTLTNAPNAVAGIGAYANGQLGANKAYLVIDTVTNVVSSVTPS